ncbi:MAG: RNA polymerase sigma factor [Pseudomonadota bacterium]
MRSVISPGITFSLKGATSAYVNGPVVLKSNAQVLFPWLGASHLEEPDVAQEDVQLDQTRALDGFLASVERSAFRIARYALRNQDDALDIVQEAMMQLVKSYGNRPSEEWKPLFYRILENKIRDFQRRGMVRSRVMAWFGSATTEDEPESFIDRAPDHREPTPDRQVGLDDAMSELDQAVTDLPLRQQQAFLLRTLEGLDVAQTAKAMGCSQGSVKTHYSRALQNLRKRLG